MSVDDVVLDTLVSEVAADGTVDMDLIDEPTEVFAVVVEDVRNLAYTDMTQSRIVCEVKLSDRTDYMHFVASADDVVGVGREVFADCVSGKYGRVELITQDQISAVELAQAKTQKLLEINELMQAYVDHATGADILPRAEVESWTIQREEAKAWKVNPSTPTPNIDRIAIKRGVPLDDLRAGAYKKAMLFEQIISEAVGLRQKYSDALRVAKTIEQINAIVVNYGSA